MRALAALAIVFLLAGCLGGGDDGDGDPDAMRPTPCIHPYPCGDGSEWPVGLEGPFAVGRYERLSIPMDDGVILDGGVVLPDLPDGVQAPTVLLLTPYVGTQNEPGDSPGILDYTFDAPVRALVEAGFAFATVSVRGTANSGGCFGFFQPREQLDAPLVVEWLAAQPWSNGRVGGIGVSYPATEALMEAIAAPPALKTVVVGGTHGDPYLRVATPQGATNTYFAAFDSTPAFPLLNSYAPPATTTDPQYATVDHVPAAIEHVCASDDLGRSETLGQFGDDRDQAYWDSVRLNDRFADVTAAVWYVQGFADRGLAFTDDIAWPTLTHAPKRILSGLWGHELPDGGGTFPEHAVDDFNERLLAWFDYWLKGIGDSPPGLGDVEVQDGLGGWHTWHSWPPTEARSEALYLTAAGATLTVGSAGPAFTPVPEPGYTPILLLFTDATNAANLLCPKPGPATTALYWTEAATSDMLLAGNPYAYVALTSDQPSALLTMVLFDVGPDFQCDATGNALGSDGARPLGFGAADLRFRDGFVADPFPVGAETWLRIDVHGIAEPVAAGHRLAVAFTYGDPSQKHATPGPAPATFRIGGASFLDLPVVEGGFGASPPTVLAPPRPFQPPGFPASAT